MEAKPPFLYAVLVVLLAGWSVPTHAQAPNTGASSVQRARLHLSAADWRSAAKAASGIRVDEAVRLRRGADTGTVLSSVIGLPFPANAVGLHWDADVPDGADLRIELRTSTDRSTWTEWVILPHRTPVSAPPSDAEHAASYVGDVAAGPLLVKPGTRYVQARLTLQATDTASPTLQRLSFHVINSTDGPAPPKDIRGPGGTADTSKPRIYARSEWGAQPPSQGYQYERATHLAIHHTATASAGAADTWTDCAAAVRAIQDFHMNTRGWIDIGYNYLVCQTGAIFQGREDGNPTRDVVAAHDGYNDGSVGTAGLGYFHPPENQQPTPSLIDSFVDLFAWIAQRRRIRPRGFSFYEGYGRTFRTIYGHRDIKATACPGDLFYPKRSAIVRRVDDRVDLPPTTTTVSRNIPNPARSQTRFELALSAQTSVTLQVYDLLGRRVATRRYGSFSPGTHEVHVRTANWAAGTYPYRLVLDEQTKTGSIEVVR
ncbi:MAG: N-acetylmuramoyl-L-alanine amidase [Salinibacter sp.]|uniref:N-acetylmuramoyl-L-alanine amidase n=1 Tax=Salinibacter sp. TaxID=2065818 RepID=UPI0035D3FF23